MLNLAKMRLAQVADLINSNGLGSLLGEVVFFGRTAIVVEKDLAELKERPEPLKNAKLRLVEIDEEMLSSGNYRFAIRYRYLKALNYLKHGYGGYALLRDNVVVGDTWHYTTEATENPRLLQEDLQQFGFKRWLNTDVYTFDIFVAPGERRGGISAAFQNSAMLALRSKGYTRAYGFYWADNIPARWCTQKTNKWKEVRAFSVSRFLVFKRAVPLHNHPIVQNQAGLGGTRSRFEIEGFNHGRIVDESKSGF